MTTKIDFARRYSSVLGVCYGAIGGHLLAVMAFSPTNIARLVFAVAGACIGCVLAIVLFRNEQGNDDRQSVLADLYWFLWYSLPVLIVLWGLLAPAMDAAK